MCKELKTGDLIKVGNHVEVFLFTSHGTTYYVDRWKYQDDWILSSIRRCSDSYVVPVPKVLRVKKASEIVKWLEDNGYQVDHKGRWYKPGLWSFNEEMFQYCGQESSRFNHWVPEWLEETYEPTA